MIGMRMGTYHPIEPLHADRAEILQHLVAPADLTCVDASGSVDILEAASGP